MESVSEKLLKDIRSSTEILSQDYFNVRESEGFVKGYAPMTGGSPYLSPNYSKSDYDVFYELYTRDPVVRGSVDTVAEESIKNKGYFLGSPTAIEKATALFEKLDFYTVAETHVRIQHLYGNSFVEKRFSENGKLDELFNLESTEMFIGYNEHGKILYFEQRPWGHNMLTDAKAPANTETYTKRWSPELVVFLPLLKVGSKVNSEWPLAPAARALSTRQFANYYIESIFKNFRPQTLYSIENNVSPDQVKSLVEAIRAADKDPSKKILSVGDVKVQTSGMYEFKKDLVDILNYVRQEVLITTRVPGSYVGVTDNSNRGIGEMEAAAFQSHLLRVQRDIEKLAKSVLESAGIKATFKCKPPSIKSQTDIIDQAKKLRDMGYGDEVITKFLYENGISIPEDAEFEEENKISMDDYESRQGSGKGVTEGKYDLDETGRSNDGKEKMEESDKKLRAKQEVAFHDI